MEDIADVLRELAEKLGTSVGDLAPHVVRHTQIDMTLAVIFGGLVALCGVLVLGIALPKAYHARAESNGEDMAVPILWVAGAAIIVLGVFGAFCGLSGALEPTGCVIKDLLGK